MMSMDVIRRGGHPVVGFALGEAQFAALGDAWPGDLLAYRQEWEPFVAAHLALWRRMNTLFEGTAASKQCPTDIFTDAQIQSLSPALHSFCASLLLTRKYTSDTDPNGILTQWNAWQGKSSSEVLSGAASMLKWHQDVVARVGGPYKDELVQIARFWNLDLQLPDLPSFSTQQSIIAQIEGAYIAAKGVLQVAGYGAGQTLVWAGTTTQAVAQGLTDTVKELPKVVGVLENPWVWLGVAAIVVGGVLLVYVPRPRPQQQP